MNPRANLLSRILLKLYVILNRFAARIVCIYINEKDISVKIEEKGEREE